MIPYFEWIHELYNIICLLVIPIICCTIFYFVRPNLVWISPLVIIVVFIIISAVFYPYLFKDILNSDYDSTTIYWLMFYVPFQIISALFFTGITYIIIKKQGK